MIGITITPGRIRAEGHARDAAGCAAVSAVLYALAGGLENIGCARHWYIDSGDADIDIPGTQEAQIMRLMAEVGLRQLAAAREDIRIPGETTAGPGCAIINDTRERPQEGLCEF